MKNKTLMILIVTILIFAGIIFYFFYLSNQDVFLDDDNFDYLACNLNNDCTSISYKINGCCSSYCQLAINRKGFKKQKDWRKNNCQKFLNENLCKMVECMAPKDVLCLQNKCTVKE